MICALVFLLPRFPTLGHKRLLCRRNSSASHRYRCTQRCLFASLLSLSNGIWNAPICFLVASPSRDRRKINVEGQDMRKLIKNIGRAVTERERNKRYTIVFFCGPSMQRKKRKQVQRPKKEIKDRTGHFLQQTSRDTFLLLAVASFSSCHVWG